MIKKTFSILLTAAIIMIGGKAIPVRAEEGLVAHWTFDEGSGTTLHDSSGNGNNGTIYNATWVDGKIGKALEFDGISSRAVVPNSPSINIKSAPMTIEMWIKTEENTTQGSVDRGVLMKNNNTDLAWGVYYRHSEDKLRWKIGTDVGLQETNLGLSKNQWKHITLVLTDVGYMRIYVNGNFSNVGWLTKGSHMISNDLSLWIGGVGTDSAGRYFKGTIDNLKLYSRALSNDEINHAAGNPPKPLKLKNFIFYSGQVRYNQLNDAQLAKIKDSPFDSFSMGLVAGDMTVMTNVDALRANTEAIKRQSKQIWPKLWLFRLSGYCDEGDAAAFSCGCPVKPANKPSGSNGYFYPTDYYALDEPGALSDFYAMYRTSLELIKENGSEGISIDPEMYMNNCLYNTSYIAAKKGITVEQAKEKLKMIGVKLADITNEVKPDAKILFLFSSLDHWEFSSNEIVRGMLQRAKERSYQFQVIDGCETCHYLHMSFSDLVNQMRARDANMASALAQYPNFKAGASHALFLDLDDPRWQSQKSGWETYRSPIEVYKLADFYPQTQWLTQTYEYVWLYNFGWYDDFIPSFDTSAYPESEMLEYRNYLKGVLCGNGTCESDRAETFTTCPVDCGSSKKADINQDSHINVSDLGILMSDFLKSAASATNPRSDINSDGAVNVVDLGIMMSAWGS